MSAIASAPGAALVFAISSVARLPLTMLSIGLLVHARHLTGSFAAAGGVTRADATPPRGGGPAARRRPRAPDRPPARGPRRPRVRDRAGQPADRRLRAHALPRPHRRRRRRPCRLRRRRLGERADLDRRPAAGA